MQKRDGEGMRDMGMPVAATTLVFVIIAIVDTIIRDVMMAVE